MVAYKTISLVLREQWKAEKVTVSPSVRLSFLSKRSVRDSSHDNGNASFPLSERMCTSCVHVVVVYGVGVYFMCFCQWKTPLNSYSLNPTYSNTELNTCCTFTHIVTHCAFT